MLLVALSKAATLKQLGYSLAIGKLSCPRSLTGVHCLLNAFCKAKYASLVKQPNCNPTIEVTLKFQ